MTGSKIFFSYTREDSNFALQLATDLRKSGADIWMDQLDIRAGTRWDVEVEKALQISESLLVILTPESILSHNVSDEISYAFDEKKTVIPVLMKECKIPFRLRRLQYADFTKEYDKGFTELLKALNLTVNTKIEKKSIQSIPAKPIVEAKKSEKKKKIQQTNKKENTATIKPNNDSISGNPKDEERVLLKFEGIDYSFDRQNNKAGVHGNLIVKSNSIKFVAVSPKESFLIKQIKDIRFLGANGEFLNNYMEVTYFEGTKLSVIYFMHFTFFTEKPTFNMTKQIKELIRQKKFILTDKK